ELHERDPARADALSGEHAGKGERVRRLMEYDGQEHGKSGQDPAAHRQLRRSTLDGFELHGPGQADPVHEGVEGQPPNCRPSRHSRRGRPVVPGFVGYGCMLVPVMVIMMVLVSPTIHLVAMRSDEALNAKQAYNSERHPPTKINPGHLDGLRHHME